MIMSSSNLTTFLYLFTLTLIPTVFGSNHLYYFCSTSQNFTTYSPYETNLKNVVASLSLVTPLTGFGVSSLGQYQDRVNGLALCRGDVNAADCKTCVVEAGREVHDLCPSNKGAIVWYDHCMLKYSNEDFYGKIDGKNRFYMWNLRNVSDPTSFNQKARYLLSQLANRAFVNPKMYSSGEEKLEESTKKLYGLVQCTRDLSSSDCKKCLDGIIDELPSCCDGKEGGRVVGGSCNIRYEIYPFVNA